MNEFKRFCAIRRVCSFLGFQFGIAVVALNVMLGISLLEGSDTCIEDPEFVASTIPAYISLGLSLSLASGLEFLTFSKLKADFRLKGEVDEDKAEQAFDCIRRTYVRSLKFLAIVCLVSLGAQLYFFSRTSFMLSFCGAMLCLIIIRINGAR